MKRIMMNVIKSERSAMLPFAVFALCITGGPSLGLAQQSVQATFPSVAEASEKLFQAVQSNDERAIANIVGGSTELTSSRDPGQDKVDREMFVQKYQEMHRLSREPDGSVTLYLGAENWPFPIPLVKENGAWRFDPEAGQKEVMFRRIGENELMAIDSCREFAAAGRGPDHGDPVLVHGYYFRLISMASAKGKTPGESVLIAYPAEYRSSGVMTFIVTKGGVVYEKDLGANTSALASAMSAFHKDGTWRPAEE